MSCFGLWRGSLNCLFNMIINSKFIDYYDSLAGQYPDKKVVYNRKRETFYDVDIPKEFHPIINKYCCGGTWTIGGRLSKRKDYVGVMLFCGKIFPFGYAETNQVPRDFKTPYAEINQEKTRYFRSPFIKIPEYDGSGYEHPIAIELCQKYGPVILVHFEYRDSYVEINPCLKKEKFHLDAYTVYQDILSFLMAHNPVVPEMNDEIKAEARGFDDLSFRREPGGPTRKRKKLIKK